MADSSRTELIDIVSFCIESEGVSDCYFMTDSKPAIRKKDNITVMTEREVITDSDIENFLEKFAIKVDNIPHDFGVTYNNRRIRGNIDRRWQGLDLTLRILPSKIKSLEDLNLPPHLYKLMDSKHGLVLICGPTGSGKSTTMASLIDYVNNKYSRKIITIEDPVEYIIYENKALISQREIGNEQTFPSCIKSAMRQKPDIIVIGEIRDREPAKTALQAAETGHMVITTMHTDSVEQTIKRFVDMFAEDDKNNIRSSLSTVLKAVIVQILIRGKNETIRPAYEICFVNKPIQSAIREGKLHQLGNLIISSEGSNSINDSLLNLVDIGHITYEEAKRYSHNADEM